MAAAQIASPPGLECTELPCRCQHERRAAGASCPAAGAPTLLGGRIPPPAVPTKLGAEALEATPLGSVTLQRTKSSKAQRLTCNSSDGADMSHAVIKTKSDASNTSGDSKRQAAAKRLDHLQGVSERAKQLASVSQLKAIEQLEEEEKSTTASDSGAPHEAGGKLMTTLMIRNIPVMYTQDMLALEWKNEGTYDLLYLPFSCTLQRNLSYAFINFVTEEYAHAFKAFWQKKRLAHFTVRKSLSISFADVQGRDTNLRQLNKKRVRRINVRQCQPIIFEDGRRIQLSEALGHLDRRL